MKILLRNIETARYLALENWVPDAASAFDFAKPEQAIEFTKLHSLQKMEVVLRYESPVSEMALPIPASATAPTSATKAGFF